MPKYYQWLPLSRDLYFVCLSLSMITKFAISILKIITFNNGRNFIYGKIDMVYL